tara:strand:- start:50 stop:283 length:234 start_codon:yes stop_codon:yes gene_type:complete
MSSDIYSKVIQKSLEFRDASYESSYGITSKEDFEKLKNDPQFIKRTQECADRTKELFQLLDELDVYEGRMPKRPEPR